MRSVLLVLLAACGSTSPPAANPPTGKQVVRSEACPKAFGATGRCDADGTTCGYDEGSCYCGQEPICSGVNRSGEPTPPPVWVCTAKPPAVRADGCPGVANEGDPCNSTRECSYGDCGGYVLGCADGKWKTVRLIAPPP